MKRVHLASAMLLIFCLFSTMTAQTDDFSKFKTLYRSELKNAGIVGGSFVFLKDGRVAAQEFYGSANLEKKQAVDENTIYHWASNTKPFTGIGIMQLRDRGMLKLDDPVTKYLPELRDIHNSYGSMDDITIRHLMTHSGGFRNGTWPWRNNKDWEPFEPTEWSQLVAMFPFTEVQFKPGSKYSYSNPAIIYLGRIIEKLADEPFEAYIEKNIFRPLEMHSSYFDTTPPHLLKHRSHSYYIEKGKRTEGKFDANTGITVSNSGLNAPLPDMIKYVNFLIAVRTGSGGVIYDEILKRSSLEEMFRPQLKAEVDANGNPGFTTDIGLIFFLDQRISKTHLGHGGDQNGFISYIDFDPSKKAASIIVFNTNEASGEVYSRIRRALRQIF